MSEALVIESNEAGAKLILSALDSDYLLAQITHAGLEANARVGSYLSTGVAEFFAGIANDWKGWPGKRRWETLEGELALSAESDRAGHVSLRVHLRNGAPPRWSIEAELTLEAGQLERLARLARTFEQLVIHAS